MSETPDYRQILMNLIAGSVLADHMGDMANDLLYAAKKCGVEVPDDFLSSGGDAMGMDTELERLSEYLVTYHDATSLYGTELYDE